MIGVDIDSVVCNIMTPLMERLYDKYGVTVTEEDIVEWDWKLLREGRNGPRQIVGIDEIMDAFETDEFLTSCKPVDGAVRGLEILTKTFGEKNIKFITSRPEFTTLDTKMWVTETFGDYEVVFTRFGAKDKYKLKALIDDGPHNFDDFMNGHTLGVLYDRPWNRKLSGGGLLEYMTPRQNFWRVKSWPEVTAIVTSYKHLGFFGDID